MPLRFVGQPFSEDAQIGRVLRDALNDDELASLWIATAWAKRSGLSRIRSAVTEFTERGGASQVIVGIDEGGATREGLELCLELFRESFVYHDPGTRTFHPKLYAVEGTDRAVIVIGSGNLTRGGLFTNYEAALVLEAARDDDEDWQVRDDARAYFDRLLDGGDAIRPLDPDLIDVLEAEGWVTSEARQNARRAAESRQRRQRRRLFGGAVGGLAGAPAPELPALPDEEEDEDSVLTPPEAAPAPPPAPPPAPAHAAAPPAAPAAPPQVVARWRKRLPASDAQHQVGNITGNVRLTQAREFNGAIPFLTYFRYDFFGNETWISSRDRNNNVLEIATVPFDTTIMGVARGVVPLEIDHAPHRESEQHNHATVLHWGPLAPIMRQRDYTGRVLELARLSDGSYRLTIA